MSVEARTARARARAGARAIAIATAPRSRACRVRARANTANDKSHVENWVVSVPVVVGCMSYVVGRRS